MTAALRNIALYGRSGSGKSTIAGILVRDFGYRHAKTGVACREICQMLFDSTDKSILNQVTDVMRAIDPTVWLRAALRTLPDDSGQPIVLDSIRFLPDYQYVHDREFLTVRIDASQQDRILRLAKRNQVFDPLRDDLHPAEIELATADYDAVINNDGSIDDIRDRVSDLIRNSD